MALKNNMRRWLPLIAAVLLLLTLSACEDADMEGSYPGGNTLLVDPIFREFYTHLGGEAVLGPAISPLFTNGEIHYQYTLSALMVHDPTVPELQRFSLAALGKDMRISEPPVAPTVEGDDHYVNGHLIDDDFLSIYQDIGPRFVGQPITEVHYNPETKRYEQYFENLGMYRFEWEQAGIVHLLAYGAWKCDASCQSYSQFQSDSMVSRPHAVDSMFQPVVDMLGSDFTGFAISEPYPESDGMTEQVFENVVLYGTPALPGQFGLRQVPTKVGILPGIPAAAGSAEGQFYSIQGDLGFTVPFDFQDYINQHGGMAAAGNPIAPPEMLNSSVVRQCFTNYCLERHLNSSGKARFRLSGLGYTYREIHFPSGAAQVPLETAPEVQQPAEAPTQVEPAIIQEPTIVPPTEAPPVVEAQPTVETFTDSQSLNQMSLQVWETYPMVTSAQEQEIGVSVYENNAPLRSVEPELTVSLPDGGTLRYFMYPTGDDGQTRWQLDPIQAPNGTLIPYQVCVASLSGDWFCVMDSFLIWQNP